MAKIIFPRNFVNHNSILPVLLQTEYMFKSAGKNRTDFEYDLKQLKRISMLGVLVLYKLIDYAFKNRCFVGSYISGDSFFLESVFKHYGFLELLNSYIQNHHSNKSYGYLEFKTEGNLIIAPQPLLKNEHKHVNEMLQKKFAPELNTFYHDNSKAVDMIFGCISEIIGNFWEHAVDDNNSILVAEGNKDKIEISCADTGRGVISTLMNSKQFSSNSTPEKLLAKALTKGITSKPKTNHMGYGLWIIDEIVTRINGVFHLYSEGVYYINEYGKRKSINRGGFWQGTFIFLHLPLAKPITPSDIIRQELVPNNSLIEINFQ
ncbi:GHKL domain-containing protein [Fibrisoma montanum]|uniref:GHKL domain-containing protein n=1 Tax=Fibrisoma montanum TaxID=2305895 RepID=A0A418ME90_9BACT|nr:GHKL domain-containing protein [Fibrisoma montanum]RIV25122.1 GHKL domain-containing protein [Fibrisoma montanum]